MNDKKANKIAIVNIPIRNANEDTPWAVPKGCIWLTMQCRTSVDVRIAKSPGKAAGSQSPYFTMKSGTSWDEKDLDIKVEEGQPIYFAAASAVVIEIFMGICTEEEVA